METNQLLINYYKKEELKKAKERQQEGMPIDIISINIKEAMQDLGKIIGENVSDDIIKEIFSKFESISL